MGESQNNSNNLKTITKLVNTTVKKCSEYQLPVEKKEISEFQLRTKLVCQMTVGGVSGGSIGYSTECSRVRRQVYHFCGHSEPSTKS